MEDKTIVCVDCGKEFVFTVGEQEFYKEKGFENEPKRCPDVEELKNNKTTEDSFCFRLQVKLATFVFT